MPKVFSKLSFSRSRFSRRQLLLFTLAFGLIGGHIIYRSFAAPNPNLSGDLNGDNTVNISDLSILLSDYNTTNTNADINHDGTVNILDLSTLLTHYGQSYTGGGSNPTWATATNFVAPAFSPVRTINVTSQAQLFSAISNLQPGDYVDCQGGFTVSGEFVISKQLASWAEIHLNNTKFVGVSSVANLPAVWVNVSKNIRLYGGDVTNPNGGVGILVYDSNYVSWWNFVIHGVGSSGLAAFPISAPITNLDFKGEVYNWGQNFVWDPHAEKGTGEHGAILDDANSGLSNSRFAIYAHDGPAGAGIEMGASASTDSARNNTIYVWCQNLTFRAVVQVGGNCLQLWGHDLTGNTVKYLEAENLQGRPYDTNGLNGGQSLSTNTIEYGTASNTNLNSSLSSTESGIAAGVKWDTRSSTIFQNVSPLP